MWVKRWHAYIEDDDGNDLFVSHQEDAKGGWVRYDDHAAEVEALQARVRELEAALGPLYSAGHDVIRRVAGDPDAPDHVDMLRALTGALQGARPLAEALAAVDAEKGNDDE